MPRGAVLAARYASEYNVVHQTPEDAAAVGDRLQAACAAIGELQPRLAHPLSRDEAV